MNFDGIILDIDGTIWNTTGIVAGAWNRAILKSGCNAPQVTAAVLRKEFGKPMNQIACDLFGMLPEDRRQTLMEACCIQEQEALKNNTSDIEYPGVTKTIQSIADNQNVYIVSNCQKGYIELVMEKTGIRAFVADYECYGNTEKGKAANISAVVHRNNITSPVYVGDTQGDCDACLEAGVPFIWAAYGFGTASSYYAKISSFPELLQII